MNTPLRRLITALSLGVFLVVSLPGVAQANEQGTESGDDVAIMFDLMVLRPVGAVASVVGFVVFVGAIPISLITGSFKKSFRALVAKPFSYTVLRDLGEES